MGDGFFGSPAPEAANRIGGLASMCSGGGPTTPKGRSEANLQLGFRDLTEELGVLA